jgi:hypothetical protein
VIADELSLAVVGLDYPNRDRSCRRFEMALCVAGEPVHLVPEPRNPYDRTAVAVVSCRGTQLGYITADRCAQIGARIRAGEKHEAFFQAPGRHYATIRIRFGGGPPTLPPPPPDQPAATSDWPPPETADWGA